MSNSKNVEAFNRLIGICTGYGGTYSPGSPNLRVESLSELLSQARAVMHRVSIAKTGYETATNEREVAFVEIRQLASRILVELKSTGALPQTVADAALMVRKIRGRVLAKKPAVTEVSEAMQVSRPRVTGSDFDSVVYHFEKLIETLIAEPRYVPGIGDLQVATLQQKLHALRKANEKVVTATTGLGNARRDRNALLYFSPGSVKKTALAVKQQVKAIFGYSSEAAKAADRIKFTKYRS
ncbi:MAG TPA: hypothetical protein PKJ83_09040 [Cyclobacteriaceae bacterium]|nr:hypothetical protein [Cyclobacteriaceae bacterium]